MGGGGRPQRAPSLGLRSRRRGRWHLFDCKTPSGARGHRPLHSSAQRRPGSSQAGLGAEPVWGTPCQPSTLQRPDQPSGWRSGPAGGACGLNWPWAQSPLSGRCFPSSCPPHTPALSRGAEEGTQGSCLLGRGVSVMAAPSCRPTSSPGRGGECPGAASPSPEGAGCRAGAGGKRRASGTVHSLPPRALPGLSWGPGQRPPAGHCPVHCGACQARCPLQPDAPIATPAPSCSRLPADTPQRPVAPAHHLPGRKRLRPRPLGPCSPARPPAQCPCGCAPASPRQRRPKQHRSRRGGGRARSPWPPAVPGLARRSDAW